MIPPLDSTEQDQTWAQQMSSSDFKGVTYASLAKNALTVMYPPHDPHSQGWKMGLKRHRFWWEEVTRHTGGGCSGLNRVLGPEEAAVAPGFHNHSFPTNFLETLGWHASSVFACLCERDSLTPPGTGRESGEGRECCLWESNPSWFRSWYMQGSVVL